MLVSADSDESIITKLCKRKMNFIYPKYSYEMFPHNAFKGMIRVVMTKDGFFCKTSVYKNRIFLCQYEIISDTEIKISQKRVSLPEAEDIPFGFEHRGQSIVLEACN